MPATESRLSGGVAGLNCAMLARRSCSRRNRQTLGSRRSRDQRARAGRSQIGLLGLWTRKLIDAYHLALNVCRGCKALPPMHQIGPPIDWVSHRAATRRQRSGGRNEPPCPCRPPAEQRRECSALVSQHRSFPRRWCWLPIIQEQGEILLQRLDRARFQNEFHPFARARLLPVTSCVHCENWAGHQLAQRCRSTTRRSNGSRAPIQVLRLMLKELSADEIALLRGT